MKCLLSVSLLLFVFTVSPLKGKAVIDICKLNEIRQALVKDAIVTVRTPSSSEGDCKPSFTIPANYTLDISIESSYVPKSSSLFGGPEQHCVHVQLGGAKKYVLDCSPDDSGILSMSTFNKVIYRSLVKDVSTQAIVTIPTWTKDFKILLELNPRFKTSWSFDRSLTKILVEGESTTMKCPHANNRLSPGIYHDDLFQKEMNEIHVLSAKAVDSGKYACDVGDKKDNKVEAISSLYRLVVAEKQLLISQKEIFNATVGDKYPLYCSVKFFVGPMKGLTSADWGYIHDILSAQYKVQPSPHVPPWLSLSRVRWMDMSDSSNPSTVAEATGNLSLHADDAIGVGNGVGADDVIQGDVATPFFAVSKIIDLVVKEEDAGKDLSYRCLYSHEDSTVIGGIMSSNIVIHVRAKPTSPPLMDLSTDQIVMVVVATVTFLLIVIAIVICCVRGVPGKGKNWIRDDNPFEGSTGWSLRAETAPLNSSLPSPTTPTEGVLYQPRGAEPQGLNAESEVFFGSTFSSSPPKLPSPNANGVPFSGGSPTWSSLSRDSHRLSHDENGGGDHDASLNNDTYGICVKSPNNNEIVAT